MTNPNERPPQGPKTPGHGPVFRIFKVEPGRTMTFDCLSIKTSGVWCHWIDRRSLPCNSPEQGVCRYDHRPPTSPRRWQGWLCVRNQATREIGFFSFNMGALKDCPKLRFSTTLRGAVLRAWRTGKESNSKLCVSIGFPEKADKELPMPSDIGEFLCRLWNIPGQVIPFGVDGFPEETQLCPPPLADMIGADPLVGTIWEGKKIEEVLPPVKRESKREAFDRLRRASQ